MTSTYTQTQERLLDLLPTTEANALCYEDIADELGCSASTARDHMGELLRSPISIDSVTAPSGAKYFYLTVETISNEQLSA